MSARGKTDRALESRERKARLSVSHEVEEAILHFQALERASTSEGFVANPTSVAIHLTRAVKEEVAEGKDSSEFSLAAYTTLLALYDSGKKKKSFKPTRFEVEAIYASFRPEIRRAMIVLRNLRW